MHLSSLISGQTLWWIFNRSGSKKWMFVGITLIMFYACWVIIQIFSLLFTIILPLIFAIKLFLTVGVCRDPPHTIPPHAALFARPRSRTTHCRAAMQFAGGLSRVFGLLVQVAAPAARVSLAPSWCRYAQIRCGARGQGQPCKRGGRAV